MHHHHAPPPHILPARILILPPPTTQIRESIKALFPDRDCATLVRPVNDETLLSKLDSVPKSQLRPEFVQGLQQLLPMVLRKAQPKRLGNAVVTGPVLAALTEAYVGAINQGAVPTIATAWQGVAESECRKACDAAIEAYHAAFNVSVAADEAAMNAEHVRCVQVATSVFEDAAVGHEAPRVANQQRLGQALEAAFAAFRGKKLTEAALGCSTMLRDAGERLAQVWMCGGCLLCAIEQPLFKRWCLIMIIINNASSPSHT